MPHRRGSNGAWLEPSVHTYSMQRRAGYFKKCVARSPRKPAPRRPCADDKCRVKNASTTRNPRRWPSPTISGRIAHVDSGSCGLRAPRGAGYQLRTRAYWGTFNEQTCSGGIGPRPRRRLLDSVLRRRRQRPGDLHGWLDRGSRWKGRVLPPRRYQEGCSGSGRRGRRSRGCCTGCGSCRCGSGREACCRRTGREAGRRCEARRDDRLARRRDGEVQGRNVLALQAPQRNVLQARWCRGLAGRERCEVTSAS